MEPTDKASPAETGPGSGRGPSRIEMPMRQAEGTAVGNTGHRPGRGGCESGAAGPRCPGEAPGVLG